MEEQHAERIAETFPQESATSMLVVLDIPDEYRFMEPELVELLTAGVDPVLAAGRRGLPPSGRVG